MEIFDRLNAALKDRYQVERELGEGGMATVYLAEDLRHKRRVALKVLKPELAAVVGGERFLTEIETTARLQHPNILPLFDSGEADGFLFYVMPYVDGESLQDRLEREKQLPVDEAVRIATEVADALHSAHGHGVIHRDIKPANIMISQGRPVVADFGIALAVSAAGGHRLTETGLSLGTPHYMSPEQATGDRVLGPSSDIYSLGCVLYEMLVGEPPYTGGSAQAILGKIITCEPEPVTASRRSVPAHVDAVVAKALEKLPADRFASAADFAKALNDEGFRHRGEGGARAGTSRRASGLAGAGWGLAAVLGALCLWLVSALESPSIPPVRRFSLSTLEEDGPSEYLALAPDGSALVMSERLGRAGRSLFVRRLDDLVRTPVFGSEDAYDLAISPDGEMVAFGTENGLYLAPLDGGTVRTLMTGEVAQSLRWGGDGYIYFAGREDVFRVRSTGGEPELVLEANPGEMLGYYQPVGGGDRAVVTVIGEPSRIDIVNVASAERRVLTEGVSGYVTDTGYLVFAREGGRIFAAPLDAENMELGGSPVLLVEGVGMREDLWAAYYTLSESGDLVYWAPPIMEAQDVNELIWVDRGGGVRRVDSTWTEPFESVELSPDGTRAAVTVGVFLDTEIWVKELDNGLARRLTNYQGMNRRPVWSPDGRTVAFISDRGGRRAVYSVPVDGIATPELLFEHPGEDVDEVFWSSDGDWLVYRTGTSDNNRDVYAHRLRPDTMTIAVSAQPDVDELSPVLSPNGRWLAYVSNESGQTEVWVRPFPDVARGSRQISMDGGVEPVWSGDGDELFFRSRPGFTSVSIRTDTDFSSREPQVLFSNQISVVDQIHQSYSFDARRDRFLMIRNVGREEAGAELILIQNFIEEVKTRVGN